MWIKNFFLSSHMSLIPPSHWLVGGVLIYSNYFSTWLQVSWVRRRDWHILTSGNCRKTLLLHSVVGLRVIDFSTPIKQTKKKCSRRCRTSRVHGWWAVSDSPTDCQQQWQWAIVIIIRSAEVWRRRHQRSGIGRRRSQFDGMDLTNSICAAARCRSLHLPSKSPFLSTSSSFCFEKEKGSALKQLVAKVDGGGCVTTAGDWSIACGQCIRGQCRQSVHCRPRATPQVPLLLAAFTVLILLDGCSRVESARYFLKLLSFFIPRFTIFFFLLLLFEGGGEL